MRERTIEQIDDGFPGRSGECIGLRWVRPIFSMPARIGTTVAKQRAVLFALKNTGKSRLANSSAYFRRRVVALLPSEGEVGLKKTSLVCAVWFAKSGSRRDRSFYSENLSFDCEVFRVNVKRGLAFCSHRVNIHHHLHLPPAGLAAEDFRRLADELFGGSQHRRGFFQLQ